MRNSLIRKLKINDRFGRAHKKNTINFKSHADFLSNQLKRNYTMAC